jgi:hypothetical protein
VGRVDDAGETTLAAATAAIIAARWSAAAEVSPAHHGGHARPDAVAPSDGHPLAAYPSAAYPSVEHSPGGHAAWAPPTEPGAGHGPHANGSSGSNGHGPGHGDRGYGDRGYGDSGYGDSGNGYGGGNGFGAHGGQGDGHGPYGTATTVPFEAPVEPLVHDSASIGSAAATFFAATHMDPVPEVFAAPRIPGQRSAEAEAHGPGTPPPELTMPEFPDPFAAPSFGSEPSGGFSAFGSPVTPPARPSLAPDEVTGTRVPPGFERRTFGPYLDDPGDPVTPAAPAAPTVPAPATVPLPGDVPPAFAASFGSSGPGATTFAPGGYTSADFAPPEFAPPEFAAPEFAPPEFAPPEFAPRDAFEPPSLLPTELTPPPFDPSEFAMPDFRVDELGTDVGREVGSDPGADLGPTEGAGEFGGFTASAFAKTASTAFGYDEPGHEQAYEAGLGRLPRREGEPPRGLLPKRTPQVPDVPDIALFANDPLLDPGAAPPADGFELSRIASYLRDDEDLPAEPRPDGFDFADVLEAVRGVRDVRDAHMRWNIGAGHTLRIEFADGADEGEVTRSVVRLLREKMGLSAAPSPGLAQEETTLDRPLPRPRSSAVGSAKVPVRPTGAPARSDRPTAPALPRPSGADAPRLLVDHVQVTTVGNDAVVEVRLIDPRGASAVGRGQGPAVDAYLLRLAATSACDAVDQILAGVPGGAGASAGAGADARGRCFVEHVAVVPFGVVEVAVVVLLLTHGNTTEQVAGSAIVAGDQRDAVVRATLAALNRRLESLLS